MDGFRSQSSVTFKSGVEAAASQLKSLEEEVASLFGGDPEVDTFGLQTPDKTRILVTHQKELLKGDVAGCDVIVFAHTHRAAISRDSEGRLLINPGETSGWSFGRPSLALLETEPLDARLIWL